MSSILIVEDNRNLALGLKNNLEIEGHRVEVAEDGERGLECFTRAGWDLVVLDLMLPGMDGLQVLRELRRHDSAIPVLILTARGEESDKVRGLRLGADDYVTKPFGLLELLARVEALLRRGDPTRAQRKVERFGRVVVDLATRSVERGGAPVALAPKEFDLLAALLRRQGAVASRDELLDEVWGYASGVYSRTVDTHIGELRRKLEDNPANPRHVLTVRKAGYRLQAE